MQTSRTVRRALGRLRHRFIPRPDDRQILLGELPGGAVCAEIGVWKGDFSERIWQTTTPRELHLIDPWAFVPEFPSRWYGGAIAQQQEDMDRIHQQVTERFKTQDNVLIYRGTSASILPQFPDGYFDWIYVDGDHSYENVLDDLQISFLKVKPGGMIAGDDYMWGADQGLPVKRAVRDFLVLHNMTSHLKTIGSQFIIKL